MLSQKRSVYIGSGIALSIVLFVGGLLIGRFAIPRPVNTIGTSEAVTKNERIAEDERIARWTELKQRVLNLISAEEIEKNLQWVQCSLPFEECSLIIV